MSAEGVLCALPCSNEDWYLGISKKAAASPRGLECSIGEVLKMVFAAVADIAPPAAGLFLAASLPLLKAGTSEARDLAGGDSPIPQTVHPSPGTTGAHTQMALTALRQRAGILKTGSGLPRAALRHAAHACQRYVTDWTSSRRPSLARWRLFTRGHFDMMFLATSAFGTVRLVTRFVTSCGQGSLLKGNKTGTEGRIRMAVLFYKGEPRLVKRSDAVCCLPLPSTPPASATPGSHHQDPQTDNWRGSRLPGYRSRLQLRQRR